VANKNDNLIPGGHKLTLEEQKMGGIASGEARREKATMKATLEKMLNEKNSNGKLYKDMVTLGLIANAIDKRKGGSPEAYKVIAKILGEIDSVDDDVVAPSVNINIVDNSNLESTLYEEEE
jgi:hypothetical protein